MVSTKNSKDSSQQTKSNLYVDVTSSNKLDTCLITAISHKTWKKLVLGLFCGLLPPRNNKGSV